MASANKRREASAGILVSPGLTKKLIHGCFRAVIRSWGGLVVSVSDGLIDAAKSWIRELVIAPPLSDGEHAKFFQFGLGFSGEQASGAAIVYLASCYALSIDAGFGENRRPNRFASWELDAEFKKAGLGTVERDANGKPRATLKTASHLQGKKNHRDAIKGMAPSRRDALRSEITKLLALPASVWRHESRMVGVGVRG